MTFFPAIVIRKAKDAFEGTALLRLDSILQGELLMIDSQVRDSRIAALNRISPANLQKKRLAFTRSLSFLDKSVSLELIMTSFPSLSDPAGNRLEIALAIHCKNASEQTVKEKIIATFLSVKPLLSSCFPEADFRVVSDHRKVMLITNTTPFHSALMIHRKTEKVCLQAPFSPGRIGYTAPAADNFGGSENYMVRHVFSWYPSDDDWSTLMNVMLSHIDPVRIIIRIRQHALTAKNIGNMEEKIKKCDRFLDMKFNNNVTLREQADDIRRQILDRMNQLSEGSFDLGVFLLTAGQPDGFLGKLLADSITGPSGRSEQNPLWKSGTRISQIRVENAVEMQYIPKSIEPFSALEASCAFRLPNPPFEEIPPGFPVKKFRSALSMIEENPLAADDVLIGMNTYQGRQKPVRINNEDRFRHSFIIGQTGTGKSTQMSNMIVQDIQNGKGVAVIDPHGDMIDNIMARIPEDRADDVIFFDPLEPSRPMGFNVLEWNTLQERDLIVDEIYQCIHHSYDLSQTGGPIFEQYFRGAMGLLMGDKKRAGFTPTILDFPTFFLDEEFRDYLKSTVDDYQLHDFLAQAERAGGEATLANIAPYVISKFSRFQDTVLKRIVGQSHTTFSFEQILDQGKIFLMKLGKGRFGSMVSAFLVNMIVSRFKLAAMKRAVMPPSERRDFFLYVDEAHNLPAENFMELLSEARKYRLGLVLSTQYAGQLKNRGKNTRNNLLSAVLGNVGQIAIFRLGQEDAKEMAVSLSPVFDKQDIISLPNWHAYVRMQTKNNALAPFSLETVLDDTRYDESIAAGIKRASSLKYGMDVAAIDREIRHRRAVWQAYA